VRGNLVGFLATDLKTAGRVRFDDVGLFGPHGELRWSRRRFEELSSLTFSEGKIEIG
jgi:hypothetical protein